MHLHLVRSMAVMPLFGTARFPGPKCRKEASPQATMVLRSPPVRSLHTSSSAACLRMKEPKRSRRTRRARQKPSTLSRLFRRNQI